MKGAFIHLRNLAVLSMGHKGAAAMMFDAIQTEYIKLAPT